MGTREEMEKEIRDEEKRGRGWGVGGGEGCKTTRFCASIIHVVVVWGGSNYFFVNNPSPPASSFDTRGFR